MFSLKSMSRGAYLALALVGLSGLASAQTVLYSVGFESPFVVGDLSGQQSFITDDLPPDVFKVTATGRNGQGVIYDMSTDSAGTSWAWLDVTQAAPAGSVYVGTAWVKVDSEVLHPGFFSLAGLDFYGGTDAIGTGFARIATLQISANGDVRMYNTTITTSTTVTAPADQWHRLDLVVDYAANRCYGLVNGVDTGLSVTGTLPFVYDCDMLGNATGWNPARWDDYSLTRFNSNQQTIQGKVDLQNFPPGPAGRTIYVDLLDTNDNVIATATGTADADGYYRATTNAVGTFRAAVRGSHWLRKTAAASLTLTGSTAFRAIGPVSLTNGDVDGDNVVSVFDYIALSDAFDADDTAGNWNPEADLDGDGVVSVFDYIILSDEFDKTGE